MTIVPFTRRREPLPVEPKAEVIAPGVFGERFVEDWRDHAACRGMDQDIFFGPEERESREQLAERVAQAKAICRRCVVAEQCLAFAIKVQERHGIFGGLTPRERARRSSVRGQGKGGHNKIKTHCKRNHPLEGDNVYHYEGERHCRECRAMRRRKGSGAA